MAERKFLIKQIDCPLLLDKNREAPKIPIQFMLGDGGYEPYKIICRHYQPLIEDNHTCHLDVSTSDYCLLDEWNEF